MQIRIEKPQLCVAASLIIDDPAPSINPFYYFRLQVEREGWQRHEQYIPLDFLQQFAEVCAKRGIRGKFSVLPYPAGLGSILEGWEGCNRAELAAWLNVVRNDIAPNFDITPEILTHTLALDLATGRLLPQSEHDWMAERSLDELKAYMGAALSILKESGFAPAGITQPCWFNGSRADYAQATLEAIRAIGGPPVTYYFIDGNFNPPPLPDQEIVLLDKERGEAVMSVIAYCNDYFWPTQHVTNKRAEEVIDNLITADGRGGRLAELAAADTWLTPVCHWQTLYSDGSREGLKALDEAAARLDRTYGSRLRWFTLSEIARYRAASEGCEITMRSIDSGCVIEFDSAFDCPDFTFSIPLNQPIKHISYQRDDGRLIFKRNSDGKLLSLNAWRQNDDRVSLCFNLRRGRQAIRIEHDE